MKDTGAHCAPALYLPFSSVSSALLIIAPLGLVHGLIGAGHELIHALASALGGGETVGDAQLYAGQLVPALHGGDQLAFQLLPGFPAIPEQHKKFITAGAEYLFCILPFYPFFSLMFCLNSVIRGAGESVVPMLIAFVGQIFARAPGVILIANHFGPQYMYYGFAIGWILASSLSTTYYLSGRWKRKGLAKE